MAIECYNSGCRHHSYHDPNEEGPFCFMQKCEMDILPEAEYFPDTDRWSMPIFKEIE
jgi:hypothetical protein